MAWKNPPDPGPSQQKAAQLRPHDGHVVKSLTDGHREVIDHHGEKDDAHSTKELLSEELDHGSTISREMVVLSERESTINLGAMMEEIVTSKRDKEVRKKYIGDLRL